MRAHPLGARAAVIGTCVADHPGHGRRPGRRSAAPGSSTCRSASSCRGSAECPRRPHTCPRHAMFARYAFPPNELGYCGPPTRRAAARRRPPTSPRTPASSTAPGRTCRRIAEAAGVADPLADDVVRSYWVGGPLLRAGRPGALLARLRRAFAGQVTGLLVRARLAGARARAPQLPRVRRLSVGAVPRRRSGDSGEGDAGLPSAVGHRRVRRRRTGRADVAGR